MLGLLSFLSLLSDAAFIIAIVFIIIRAIKKRPKKPFVIMASSTFVLSVALMILVASLYEPSEKPSTGIITPSNDSQSAPETSINTSDSESATDVALGESGIDTKPFDESATSSAESTVDAENAEREQAEKEKAEKEAKEKTERERLEKEKAEKEAQDKAERERAEKEKAEREKAEKEAKEKAEREQAEKEKKEQQKKAKKTKKASKLKFDGESIIDSTVSLMKEYDYIRDVYIDVIEDEKKINIAIQVPSATDFDVAKMAGEDTARYLASLAAYANDYYEVPGVDSIGSLYDRYSLLIYIDDGYGNFDIYGAKVPTAKSITW